jgi:signal transduction histidine kinase
VGEVIADTKAAMTALAAHDQRGPVTAIVNYEQMMKIRRIAGYLDLEGGQ